MKTSVNDSLNYFKFIFGSFFGPSYFLFFDGDKRAFQYGITAHGGLLGAEENGGQARFRTTGMKPDEEQLRVFIGDLNCCRIESWRKDYSNPDILDGAHWSLEIQMEGGNLKTVSGWNAYPPEWEMFLRAVKKIAAAMEEELPEQENA